MARRSSKTSTESTATTTEVEAPTEAPQEADVSTTTDEAAPEVEAEATESNESTEAPVDLTDFKAAVEAALAEKDESTGDIALALIEPVTTEYRKLDGVKAKNQAKKVVNDDMVEAMNSMDIVTARAYLQISEHLTAGGGHKAAERVPADPTEAFVQRVGTLRLADQLAVVEVPEGVDEDWATKTESFVSDNLDAAQSYLAWFTGDEDSRGDEPEATAVVKNAVKLAMGKQAKAGARAGGGSTFTGERRDIGKHIAEAFAEQEVGTFLTVAEIRKFKSEEYGDQPPSAGAISARLFPQNDGSKSTMRKVGLESTTNDKGNKGALKVTDGEPID